MRKIRIPIWILVAIIATGCASQAQTPATSPAPGSSASQASAELPGSIRWVQSSAEYMAATVMTYRVALEKVEAAARGRAPGTWAVVLDADDTIINNVQYQAGLARDGVRHTPERFTAWVRQRASTPVPGAARFLTRVRELGARIAIVTNRLQIECDDTAEVLRMNKLVFDAVICRPEGEGSSDKTPRYRAVAAGETAASRTPVEIVAFIGDNILDFPSTSQAMRAQGEAAFSEFGVRWFMLPNPMYGSWDTPVAAPAAKAAAADVRFMQGMIGHHAQAIDMVAMLKTRTARDDMKLLALRIEVSQNDEMAMMRRWLRERGAAEPDAHAMHAHDAKLMPGMLTPGQMAQLTAAKDAEFDRLFLEFMIQHHEGALVMVKDLMATPGGGQESSVFQFASDVEADQSAEINRMRAMRARMGK